MNIMAIMTRAHLPRIDLNLLKVFAAVYRERHITRADHSLFISQSAVTHAIARIVFTVGMTSPQPFHLLPALYRSLPDAAPDLTP